MRLAGLAVVVVIAGACSGGGSSLSLDDLRDTGSKCPVDVAGAVDGAGKVSVDVEEGSGTGDLDDSAIDQAGGIYVECTVPVDDGEVDVVLFGSKHKSAVNLLLPQINADLDMGVDELPKVVDRYMAADDGELIDLPDGAPGAIAPVDIEDAESGVLYVSSDSLSPKQVRKIAESILSAQ